MFNLTLLSLISFHHYENSPFLELTNINNIRLENCYYFYCFNSVIRVELLKSHIFTIQRSKMKHILDTAIHIEYEKSERISIENQSTFNCINNEFSYCNGYKGGAIYTESKEIMIKNCLFINNTGNYGSCLYAMNLHYGKFNDSLIKYNYAYNLGAGFFIDCNDNDNEINIRHCNFTYQTAKCVGALECWGGIPYISFCIIDHCKSTFGLPSVRTSSLIHSSKLENIIFFNCSSRQYGAVFQSFQYESMAYIKDCIMRDNWCLGENGTTVFIQNKRVKVTLENCIIYGKRERQFGGIKKMDEIILINNTFIYDIIKDYYKDTPAPTMSPYFKKHKFTNYTKI